MTLRQLCKKDVVQLGSGVKLGRADDLELEMGSAQVCSLILRGRPRWFGLLGRGEDLVIPWQQIETIGEDVILVNCPVQDLASTAGGRWASGDFSQFCKQLITCAAHRARRIINSVSIYYGICRKNTPKVGLPGK